MTFIELLVVMAVMTVAVVMFTSMVVHTSRQRGINRENAIAANAARTAVELMRNEDFRDVFALYNAKPADDPGGAGTAPGNVFAVFGLTPLAGDPDGLAGEIFLPVLVETVATESSTWGVTTLDTTEVKLGETVVESGGTLGGKLGGLSGGGAYYTLREDFFDARLGMPRDLNGDSLIDDLDHSLDYIVLPIHVRVSWRGRFGPRTYDLYTQIALFAKAGG